jgi:hypothetical protein
MADITTLFRDHTFGIHLLQYQQFPFIDVALPKVPNFYWLLAVKHVRLRPAMLITYKGNNTNGEFPMYRVSETVRAKHTQDGTIILAIHTSQVLRLNLTGSLVFQQLQNGATESQMVQAIAERFDVSSQDVSNDVYHFLQILQQFDLVHGGIPARIRKNNGDPKSAKI